MKKGYLLAVIAVVALVLGACTPDVTVENQPAPGPGQQTGISVSGTGTVTGTPDTLTMTFGVEVLDPSVSVAVSRAAERAQAVISALDANGVAEEDIQTANYSIYPRYDWRNDQQVLLGYTVSNTVSAKIRDIDSAGQTIDAVTAAGGDDVRVSGVSFSIEDNDELISAAREAAFADAKGKAEQLATLGGVTLGSPVTISETFSSPRPPIEYAVAEDSLGGADAITPIIPGGQDVVVTITVQFDIES